MPKQLHAPDNSTVPPKPSNSSQPTHVESSTHTQITLTTKLSRTPTSLFWLLPPELREMIFSPCLTKDEDEDTDYDTSYQTPALLIALRTEQPLYQEALELFYKANVFVLGRQNVGALVGLSEGRRALVCGMEMDVRGDIVLGLDDEDYDDEWIFDGLINSFLERKPSPMMELTNLRSFCLNIEYEFVLKTEEFVVEIMEISKKLEKFELLMSPEKWEVIEKVDRRVGFHGECLYSKTGGKARRSSAHWAWEAEKGRVLGEVLSESESGSESESEGR